MSVKHNVHALERDIIIALLGGFCESVMCR